MQIYKHLKCYFFLGKMGRKKVEDIKSICFKVGNYFLNKAITNVSTKPFTINTNVFQCVAEQHIGKLRSVHTFLKTGA